MTTTAAAPRARRVYPDGCAVAHALNLIGERWALLVVRELILGPKRFTDLQAGLPAAGPNILSQRLRDLEAVGVVRRRALAPPAGSRVYELTEWGARLGPILTGLARWAALSPVVSPQGPVGADSLLLALRTSFAAPPRAAWTASYEIRLGLDAYTVHVQAGQLTAVARGPAPGRPDATLDTDRATFSALLDGHLPITDAVDAGHLTLTGDAEAAQRLLDAVRPDNPNGQGT